MPRGFRPERGCSTRSHSRSRLEQLPARLPIEHTAACGDIPLPKTWVLFDTLRSYWLSVFPTARSEIEHWQRRAVAIPDRRLRQQACATLVSERLNAEGAAIFAVLANGAERKTVVRLLVAFQVMYDYLDTLTEQPVENTLRNCRQLHGALSEPFGAPAPPGGYYAHHSDRRDGGYLAEMIARCREAFDRLPAAAAVLPSVLRTIRRAAESQSENHAALRLGRHRFIHWATAATPPQADLFWWETAAAAGSSLATHVLLASAADPALCTASAEAIEAAYWPWINGLNTLLESMVDRHEDALNGNHCYARNYATPAQLAHRLELFAHRASAAVRELPDSRRHAVILAAMTSLYLAAPQAALPDVQLAAQLVRRQLDVDVRPLLAMLRVRRRLVQRYATRSAPAATDGDAER